MFLGSWKMNATLVLFHFEEQNAQSIEWSLAIGCYYENTFFFSHWIHFDTRLLTICGHMFYQNMVKVDMLEIGSYFFIKFSHDMLLDNICHYLGLLPSFLKVIGINS